MHKQWQRQKCYNELAYTLPYELRNLFIINNNVLANHAMTVVLTPDGSKENWPDSDRGDTLRDDFIAKLNEQAYDDGSNHWDWIAVGYGEYGPSIDGSNTKDQYSYDDSAIVMGEK